MSDAVADLIARARAGDKHAFGELVRTYQRRVYATAIHLTRRHADADDIVQETFVRAYRGLATFDGRSEFFTWLYRITVNTALNHLRKQGRVGKLFEAGARETEAAGGRPESLGAEPAMPDEIMAQSAQIRRVLTEVAALSPTLRLTLVLAAVEGLAYREIAEMLEIPEGTVAWRVNEARRQLRERLDDAKNVEDSKR